MLSTGLLPVRALVLVLQEQNPMETSVLSALLSLILLDQLRVDLHQEAESKAVQLARTE
jgi:hypothetical protein